MSTVAQRLRQLANELDSGGFPTGPVLAPVVARDVKVGDVLAERFGERFTVSEVVVNSRTRSDGTTPMLSFKGHRADASYPDGWESVFSVWADQYVVVER